MVAMTALFSFVYLGGLSSSLSLFLSSCSSSFSSLTSSILAVRALPWFFLSFWGFFLSGQFCPMCPCLPHLKHRPSSKYFFRCSSVSLLSFGMVDAESASMASGSFCGFFGGFGFQAFPLLSCTISFLFLKAPTMAFHSSFRVSSSLAASIQGVSWCLSSGGVLPISFRASHLWRPCTNLVTVFWSSLVHPAFLTRCSNLLV